MDDIFSEIPNKLPLLELFFATKNTTVLRRLRDKEIKELNFYTDSKQEAESNEWAINPLVLSNIKNINLAENPTTSNYGQTSYYVIKFDNLSFDEEDVYIAGEFDLYKVNKALKMFYWTRNNEKFFQGLGLTYQLTDRDEKIKITWPLGLDFSNAPSIKSLAGLDFRNRDSNYNYNNTYRKLLRIKFYNNADMWTLNTNELNKNQVREVILGNTLSESAKITFSNGKGTTKIRVVPHTRSKNNERLDSNGTNELWKLLEYLGEVFDKYTVIIVQQEEEYLFNSIKSAGFNACYLTEADNVND